MKTPFTNGKIVGDQINNAEYHKATHARGDRNFVMTRSHLQQILTCAKRWRDGYEGDDTKATIWGSLIDCLVLTPDRFDQLFAIYPLTYPCDPTSKDPRTSKPWNANATYCREWKAEHVAAGRTCILEDKLDHDGEVVEETAATTMKRARAAVAALKADTIAWEFVACSRKQVMITVDYVDEATGLVIPVKVLIDLYPDSQHPKYGKALGDLKTTINAAPGAWEKAVVDRGYDIQAAMNILAARACGDDRVTFHHVIEESYEPWQPAKRQLAEEYLTAGAEVLLHGLAYYAQCLKHDYWPDYESGSPAGAMVINGWQMSQPPSWIVNRAAGLPQFPNIQPKAS